LEDSHLTQGLLEAIHRGARSPGDLATVAMAHLFELCPHCRSAFQGWRREIADDATREPGPDDAAAGAAGHGAPARRVRLAAPRGADPERSSTCPSPATEPEREESPAPERLRELLALPPEARAERVRRHPFRYGGPALAELLLSEARGHLPAAPVEAYAVAGLARAVLQHAAPTPEATRLYARALAHQANALRAQGELPPAAELLEAARFLVKPQGGGDRLTRAELDSFEGSLLWCQRRFEEAETRLARCAADYLAAGLRVEAARNLVKLGMVYREMADLDRALAVTRRAEELLAGTDEPRLLLTVRHNLVHLLCDLGEPARARALLAETGELYERFPDRWTGLRRLWLEGHLARAEGDVEAAERAYLAVRDGFLREGVGFDAALAALDLAVLYLEQGRTGELRRIAEEIVPVFAAQDVHREAAAALTLFQQAVRAEQVTLRFLAELARYLQRARLDPGYAFEGGSSARA
jgi:tetratricopeptide (TPR) repeat protein